MVDVLEARESVNVTMDGMANFATCRSNAQMDIQEQGVKHVLKVHIRANAAILAT